MPSLIESWNSIRTPRLLVVGDLILDRYTWGDAERVSPEAPVLVLRADEDEVRPGGAASVAALLRGLEAAVILAGVVGDDANGRVLRRILADAGIDDRLILTDSARPTTAKERFLGRTGGRQPHQMLRVDREVRTAIPPALKDSLIERIVASIPECDAVLISDYAKGVCTPELLQSIIGRARALNRPVLVDPARIADYARYRQATLLKPNRSELQLATGSPVQSTRDAAALGRRLCRDLALDAAVVTLDRDGMVLVAEDDAPEILPTKPQEVCDVTGAGDMSLAMLGLCVASRLTLKDSATLANVAAGLEVQKLGIAPVSRAEITAALTSVRGRSQSKRVTLEQMAALADRHRQEGRRIVFTNGCFDLLHVGHVTCLEEAAAMGDVLVVAVNSDASVRRLKGATRPVIAEDDRAAMLAALECVSHVLVFDEQTPHRLLTALRPDVLVKGGTTAEIVAKDVVTEYGGAVVTLRAVPGRSTTSILETFRSRSPSTVSCTVLEECQT